MISVSNGVWFFAAFWMLLLPIKWLVAASLAVLLHEIFHIIVILLFRGRIAHVHITSFGMLLETSDLAPEQEALCAIAGPTGSILGAFCIRLFPVFGICSLIHGLFNLMPVYPLDGGRSIHCLLDRFLPQYLQPICFTLECFVFLFLFAAALIGFIKFHLGLLPVLFILMVLGRALLRKRP